MKQRIQKILSARGVCSRRGAEALILAGRVCCNGVVCALGDTADDAVDSITVDGAPIPEAGDGVYILLNKPRGFVTTLSDEKGRRNAAQLVADCGVRVYPVGRLDMDSEGLLLFTSDGAFANALMHPRNAVDKTYRVKVEGYSPEALERLKKPITLDGYTVCPPAVKEEQRNGRWTQLLITIHEGRNRQVRRMCAAAGMTVRRLERISEGPLLLGDLHRGKWRHLTQQEVAALWRSAGHSPAEPAGEE